MLRPTCIALLVFVFSTTFAGGQTSGTTSTAGRNDLLQFWIAYNIPLKPGTYELHLHFAENFYGPESSEGGGEGSRTMSVSANGQILLHDFDVLADAGGDRTAEVKVFSGISPATDGLLHLTFASGQSGSAMISAIEILPGIRGQIRPVRIVARDVPYYSDDSRWNKNCRASLDWTAEAAVPTKTWTDQWVLPYMDITFPQFPFSYRHSLVHPALFAALRWYAWRS